MPNKPIIDLSGQSRGKLKILYRLHNYHKRGTYWLCLCDCGSLVISTSQNLKKIKSCLHCRRHAVKHNKCDTRLYRIWSGMKKRCCNERDPTYHNYGERGIAICQEWLDNFQAFYNWAINNNYQESLTIDRIDVNKGYEPANCRWADRHTQNVNTRRELYGIVLNEYNSIEYFSLKYGTSRRLIRQRFLTYDWSFEDSVLTPKCKDRSYKRYSSYEQH